MRKLRWPAMATIVIILVVMCSLTISFLPFFIEQVWAPLWDAAWQPLGAPARSFAHVGPAVGVLPWPALVAVPLSSLTLLLWFMLVAGIILLRRPR